MSDSAVQVPPRADLQALRAALVPLEGIRSAVLTTGRSGEEALWILMEADDMERDSRITEALLDLEPLEIHYVPPYRAGMMPDGQPVL